MKTVVISKPKNDLENVIDMYRRLHETSRMFKGYSIKSHVKAIAALIEQTGAKTLLDFGCGKGWQYTKTRVHEQWGGILPTLYDPAVYPFWDRPEGKFDGVLNIDVMEHVPEAFVDEVLADILSYANKFAFFNISTFYAKKFLPDGRNMHLTVKSEEWWSERLARLAPDIIIEVAFETPDYSEDQLARIKRGLSTAKGLTAE